MPSDDFGEELGATGSVGGPCDTPFGVSLGKPFFVLRAENILRQTLGWGCDEGIAVHLCLPVGVSVGPDGIGELIQLC